MTVENPAQVWQITKSAAAGFTKDQCARYAAALSFYALFSLAPMVLIAVEVASFLAEDVDFQRQITNQFSQLVGQRGAEGIEVLMESLEDEDVSKFQLIAGLAMLLFSATNIFIQLQTSFNNIYSVRAQEGKGFLKQLVNRLISAGMVLSLGFIMITSLIIDSLIVLMEEYLNIVFQGLTSFLVMLLQYGVLLSIIFLIIYALFHFLPDVSIKSEYKVKGTVLITVLLVAGKFLIGWYIGNSRFGELGGAAASIVILMIWIYFSSLILFFGAEVIKALAQFHDTELEPRRFAVKMQFIERKDPEQS